MSTRPRSSCRTASSHGPADPPPTWCKPPRRRGQEEVPQRPDDRQPVLHRRSDGRSTAHQGKDQRQALPLSEQLRDHPASATSWHASPASGDITYLGQRDYTACASGSTPARCRIAACRRATSSRPSSSKTFRSPPARSVRPPCPKGPGVRVHHRRLWAGLTDENQFGDMVLKTDAAGRVMAMLTWPETMAKIQLGANPTTRPVRSIPRPSVALSGSTSAAPAPTL